MAVQLDVTPRAVAEPNSGIATTLGVGGLGGAIGVRVTIDDAVLTSKEQVIQALEAVRNSVVMDTWPIT